MSILIGLAIFMFGFVSGVVVLAWFQVCEKELK
jgi:hypothetical protein